MQGKGISSLHASIVFAALYRAVCIWILDYGRVDLGWGGGGVACNSLVELQTLLSSL